MSRGNKVLSAGVAFLALAFAFVWASPATAAPTKSGAVASVDDIAPDAPTNLEAEVDFSVPSVVLTWDASPSDAQRSEPTGSDLTSGGSFTSVNDVTHYNIWRGELTGELGLIDNITSGQLASYSYVDTAVESGMGYEYSVTAADRGGNESAAIESGPVTLGAPPNADIFPTEDISWAGLASDEIASETIGVSNSATADDAILSVTATVEGTGFSAAPESITLAAGEEGSVDVSFSAAAVGNVNGSYEGVLTIKTNDPENRTIVIALSAGITDGLTEPLIDLSGTNFKFSRTLVDASKSKALTITNKGDLGLEGSLAVVGDASFSVDAGTFSLAGGEAADISIVFSPAATGNFAATITLTSNDPIRPELEVTATGVAVSEITGARVETYKDPETGKEVEVVGFMDGDDDIDLEDFFAFADEFVNAQSGEEFNSAADFDGDGTVDLVDFFQFADSFALLGGSDI